MRKTLWVILGLFFVGCAYIGIILPGVPTTFFVILAAWAFSKSSKKFDKWIHEHKLFGKYLTNWETKRIYPYRGRYAMVGVFIAKKTTGVAVAVTGAGENGVFRCSEIENALNSSFNVGSIDNVEISPDGLNNDIHASASYRANLIKEMAKRAFNEMI